MPKPQPRIRKQKARRRSVAENGIKAQQSTTHEDTNAIEILPEEQKKRVRDEVFAVAAGSTGKHGDGEAPMGSKKRKRLEKYIETKLKKEENAVLIRKLAQQRQGFNTGLLRSSKTLGRGGESKKERLGRVLRETRAGIVKDGEEAALFETRQLNDEEDEEEMENLDAVEEHADPMHTSTSKVQDADTTAEKHEKPLAEVVRFGGGLKRPLDVDSDGNPAIAKRKRLKRKERVSSRLEPTSNSAEEPEWEGFSSASEDGRVPLDNNIARILDGTQKESESSAEEGLESTDNTSINEDESQRGEDIDVAVSDSKDSMLQERASAFKTWALQQRNDALGFVPSTNNEIFAAQKSKLPPPTEPDEQIPSTRPDQKIPFRGSNGEQPDTEVSKPDSYRKAFNVPVMRSEEIEEARLALPVVAEEQKIMEAIHNNNVTVICGATGSGKTTQIPQFLYEAGYGSNESPNPGMVGVTQPRRVAAVSMAKRVAVELGDLKDKVSYQIRYDSTVSASTAVKFMTDGVLVREIAQDFTLSKYSALVIDEAHERSVNTDILIGMLSRIVETRAGLAKKTSKYKPLKLIIMSATLQTAEITGNRDLFRHAVPPIIQAEGRQHPVTIHFSKRTQRDYLQEVFRKISKGHKQLPPGAILVFLTGQNEITNLSKRLKQALPSTDPVTSDNRLVRTSAAQATVEAEDMDLDGYNNIDDAEESDSDAEIYGVDDEDDEEKEFDLGNDTPEFMKVHILPLYSQLPTDQQMKIFQPPPARSRLIVLATNVAETSLTIPGVRYVFDCGRAKERHYDKTTGVQTFDVGWISKASASQRAGRAGRTGPGHCYRLYSSAVYERDFSEFGEPEILRTPIEGVVLQLKSMGIPKIANFPFPTPPHGTSLDQAERLLEYLGAIVDGNVTPLGEELSVYPLSPRLSRMLCIAQGHGVVDHTIALVAALTVADIFIPENQLDIQEHVRSDGDTSWTEQDNKEALQKERRRKEYNAFHANLSRLDRKSDGLKLLATICDFLDYGSASSSSSNEEYRKYTRIKALREALQLRSQLTAIVATHQPGMTHQTPRHVLPAPSKTQSKLLGQILVAGYIDQVALRADLSPTPPEHLRKPKRAAEVPYITLFPSSTLGPGKHSTAHAENDPEARARESYVYIHPSSVLAHVAPGSLPQYLVYSHLSRSAPTYINDPVISTHPATAKPTKTRVHPLTPVSAAQIVALAQGTPLLEDGKPVGKIETLERDLQGRDRRVVWTVPFLRGRIGGLGWPLPPARRVVQVRTPGKGWTLEK